MKILLLGPQGSGKGTQAKRIAEEYGLAHVSTGDMLRAEAASESDLGRRVGEIMSRGDLVPDDLMVDIIRNRLDRDDARDGFILDGFPRTDAQAEALEAMLAETGRDLDVVFELQVGDETSVERMRGRAQTEGRADDTEEAMRRRLELYHRETAPLSQRYLARGILVGIHGERTVDEVFAEIQRTLDELESRSVA